MTAKKCTCKEAREAFMKAWKASSKAREAWEASSKATEACEVCNDK